MDNQEKGSELHEVLDSKSSFKKKKIYKEEGNFFLFLEHFIFEKMSHSTSWKPFFS